jgi:hypothetical protein
MWLEITGSCPPSDTGLKKSGVGAPLRAERPSAARPSVGRSAHGGGAARELSYIKRKSMPNLMIILLLFLQKQNL